MQSNPASLVSELIARTHPDHVPVMHEHMHEALAKIAYVIEDLQRQVSELKAGRDLGGKSE